jgi:hypothetical protein
MITPSFAITATERVLPRMALDFTTATLDSRVTFTRTGNTATVINSSGLVAPINADLPRFDYDPTTLLCKGLLIEESSVNLLTYSELFSNAVWNVKTNVGVATSATTDPAGGTNAFTLTANATNVIFGRTIAGTIGLPYSYSIWMRRKTGTGDISVAVGDNVFVQVGSQVTSAWKRITVTRTPTSLTLRVYIGINVSGNEIEIYGAQAEQKAFGSSYIPTVAATVTRNPDIAVMTSTNFSSWYTATTGAAVVWAIPQTATGVRPLIQFDDTTALEIITLRANVADPELYVVDTLAQAQIDVGTIVANTAYKLSGAWNTDSCAAAKDGGAVGTDNTATIPTPTQLRIGSDGTNYASAWVQKILYYPQRIIDAEVQAISK